MSDFCEVCKKAPVSIWDGKCLNDSCPSFGNQTGGSKESLSSDAQYDELLAEFVRLSPDEWRAFRYTTTGKGWGLRLGDVKSTMLVPITIWLDDDRASAEALIYLLDWLEGQGWIWSLDNLGFNESTGAQGYRLSTAFREWKGTIVGEGKTRIEAVVRAVVAVLGEKK